jgi:hypothetical protein
VGISTIEKFTSGRGWGKIETWYLAWVEMTMWSCAFNIFICGAQPHPAGKSVLKNVTEILTLNHICLWSGWLGKCLVL